MLLQPEYAFRYYNIDHELRDATALELSQPHAQPSSADALLAAVGAPQAPRSELSKALESLEANSYFVWAIAGLCRSVQRLALSLCCRGRTRTRRRRASAESKLMLPRASDGAVADRDIRQVQLPAR